MKKQFIIVAAFFALLYITVPALAQKGISGTWVWTSPINGENSRDYISIDIKPRNGKVAGTFFYNEVDKNGDTESDGGVTPFIGTLTGNTVKIEFDPNAEEPGYTKNARYKKPKGKLPNLGTLSLKSGKLVWTQTRGSLGKGIPKQFTMHRSK